MGHVYVCTIKNIAVFAAYFLLPQNLISAIGDNDIDFIIYNFC